MELGSTVSAVLGGRSTHPKQLAHNSHCEKFMFKFVCLRPIFISSWNNQGPFLRDFSGNYLDMIFIKIGHILGLLRAGRNHGLGLVCVCPEEERSVRACAGSLSPTGWGPCSTCDTSPPLSCSAPSVSLATCRGCCRQDSPDGEQKIADLESHTLEPFVFRSHLKLK